jgi:hypothetical protein
MITWETPRALRPTRVVALIARSIGVVLAAATVSGPLAPDPPPGDALEDDAAWRSARQHDPTTIVNQTRGTRDVPEQHI